MTREEAIDIIRQYECCKEHCEACEMAISALEQQPCEDAISREAAINIASLHCLTIDETVKALEQLPSVTQKPKTGHWIEKDGFDGDVYYDCSECGESWTTIEGTPWDNEWKYCPNCGCRMVEPRESEDKE